MKDGFGRVSTDQTGSGGKVRDRSQLVVYVHHGHEGSVLRERVPKGRQIGIPLLVHRKDHDVHISALLQRLDCLKHRGMLHRRSNDPFGTTPAPKGPENSGVIALRAAGSEDDLLSLRAKGPGDDRPRFVDPLFRAGAEGIGGRRVVEVLRHGLHGGLGCLRQGPRGGAVIQINHIVSILSQYTLCYSKDGHRVTLRRAAIFIPHM